MLAVQEYAGMEFFVVVNSFDNPHAPISVQALVEFWQDLTEKEKRAYYEAAVISGIAGTA